MENRRISKFRLCRHHDPDERRWNTSFTLATSSIYSIPHRTLLCIDAICFLWRIAARWALFLFASSLLPLMCRYIKYTSSGSALDDASECDVFTELIDFSLLRYSQAAAQEICHICTLSALLFCCCVHMSTAPYITASHRHPDRYTLSDCLSI